MFSERFGKPIVLTSHARARMGSRMISAALLHDLIETGEVRRMDETRIWIAKGYEDRADNLCGGRAGDGISDQDSDASLYLGVGIMKTIYYPQDDILEIRLSDKPVVREVSQDWNVNVSYAEDGSVVELVISTYTPGLAPGQLSLKARGPYPAPSGWLWLILDAVKAGFIPFEGGDRKAA